MELREFDLNSPFTLINEKLNLSGSGYAALNTPEGTYFGTNNGLLPFTGWKYQAH